MAPRPTNVVSIPPTGIETTLDALACASVDRTVLITGGTGGLGRAVVAAFAANEWRVVVLDMRPAELQGAEVVEADLTDPDDVARAVRAGSTEQGAPLRAVANLVGGFAGGQPVAQTPVAEFEAQFALNLRPTYLVTQATLPALVAAGGGTIVCVSSRSALHPFAGAAGYCASKAAVIAFAQVVAREHAADGVRCNAVLPQMIDTPANRAAIPPEQHGSLTPPAEIAAVIRFLCSAESSPTTGAAIPVYGAP
jgi:NAD(P)-dependent dehydrogenase (short-subunit alcohol dehydrogenase family)